MPITADSPAIEIFTAITDRPISVDVFRDEFDEMQAQANKIAAWGDNVHVKIPVTNKGQSAGPPIRGLGRDLTEFSRDTVKMVHRDAASAGYSL